MKTDENVPKSWLNGPKEFPVRSMNPKIILPRKSNSNPDRIACGNSIKLPLSKVGDISVNRVTQGRHRYPASGTGLRPGVMAYPLV